MQCHAARVQEMRKFLARAWGPTPLGGPRRLPSAACSAVSSLLENFGIETQCLLTVGTSPREGRERCCLLHFCSCRSSAERSVHAFRTGVKAYPAILFYPKRRV